MVHGRIVIALIGLLAALVAGPARATEPDTWIFAYGDEARTARGAEIEALIEQDFVAYDPDYLARKAEFGARLHALAARLAALQAGGNEMACSTQIFSRGEVALSPHGPLAPPRAAARAACREPGEPGSGIRHPTVAGRRLLGRLS